MHQRSFIKKTLIILSLLVFLLVVIFFSYMFFSYQSLVNDIKNASESYLNLYGSELDNKIENSNKILEQLIFDNTEYLLLQSEDEAARYYAARTLFLQMQEFLVYDKNVAFIIVSEDTYKTCLITESIPVTQKFREEIKKFSLYSITAKQSPTSWKYKELNGSGFLYKMFIWQDRCAGVFMAVDTFLNTASGLSNTDIAIFLRDDMGHVLGKTHQKEELNNEAKNTAWLSYYLADPSFYLTAYSSAVISKQYSSKGTFLILGILFVTLIFGVFMERAAHKEIIVPMLKLQKNMECIMNGNYNHRINDDFPNKEFLQLKDSFNKMMDEIVSLKIASYEKQIVLQESELKCIKLQIRPHFFLNSLTTISSLSQKKKHDEIVLYIDNLSKNIRYMFKSGFHTVRLEEELFHVENYFTMQELKYPSCVFHLVSLKDEKLKKWNVPQMVIHTVIENEYKYAVSMDRVLSIFITISSCIQQNVPMLCIEIEDDGDGYPDDILQLFNSDAAIEIDGNRTGLMSLKKMLELMYEKKSLFTIRNIKPHGCLNTLYIPEYAVNEVKNEIKKVEIL